MTVEEGKLAALLLCPLGRKHLRRVLSFLPQPLAGEAMREMKWAEDAGWRRSLEVLRRFRRHLNEGERAPRFTGVGKPAYGFGGRLLVSHSPSVLCAQLNGMHREQLVEELRRLALEIGDRWREGDFQEGETLLSWTRDLLGELEGRWAFFLVGLLLEVDREFVGELCSGEQWLSLLGKVDAGLVAEAGGGLSPRELATALCGFDSTKRVAVIRRLDPLLRSRVEEILVSEPAARIVDVERCQRLLLLEVARSVAGGTERVSGG